MEYVRMVVQGTSSNALYPIQDKDTGSETLTQVAATRWQRQSQGAEGSPASERRALTTGVVFA